MGFPPHCSKSGFLGLGSRRTAGHELFVGMGGNCSYDSPPFPATTSPTTSPADLSPGKYPSYPPVLVASPVLPHLTARTPHPRPSSNPGQSISRGSCQPAKKSVWFVGLSSGASAYQVWMPPCTKFSIGTPHLNPAYGNCGYDSPPVSATTSSTDPSADLPSETSPGYPPVQVSLPGNPELTLHSIV